VIVGVLRLLGFNVFRNTYKPLLAESVVDFWNRYYYYFKELLAEFFFYPIYTRFAVRPWLRTFLAIFAAAFVGNLYYHLLQLDAPLLAGNLAELWTSLESRTVYCFLLAAGIFVSMIREQRRRGTPHAASSTARRTLRIVGVWTFFALIHVWAHPGTEPTLAERTAFFLSLFGL
jgi:D-alanyl-lipoteichoic acid acyltransferase DltB (MBOAT superfamily)